MPQATDDAISAVAALLLNEHPPLAARIRDEDWRKMVRAAFGPALAGLDLDAPIDENAAAVLADVRIALEECVADLGPRERSFGCTLFDAPSLAPFSIGPVRFEMRSDWLARKTTDGHVPREIQRQVERAWSGQAPRTREGGGDHDFDRDVRDAVGSCPFACSVSTTGLGQEAGLEKALAAARSALAAISLHWPAPSRALGGMNLLPDGRAHFRAHLSFGPGGACWVERRLLGRPRGTNLSAREWDELFAARQDRFNIVGEILDCMVHPTADVPRPKLMSTLAQALLWFHEGCRESVSVNAIVKFSATLDALSCGGASRGIKRLIAARLGLKDGDPIRQGGPTVKAAIDKIYGDGRSRTIHGTNEKFGHDWSGARDLSEQFARRCLLACIDWAAANPKSDDPKQLAK